MNARGACVCESEGVSLSNQPTLCTLPGTPFYSPYELSAYSTLPTPPTAHDSLHPTTSTPPHYHPATYPVHLPCITYHTRCTSPHYIYPTPLPPRYLPCPSTLHHLPHTMHITPPHLPHPTTTLNLPCPPTTHDALHSYITTTPQSTPPHYHPQTYPVHLHLPYQAYHARRTSPLHHHNPTFYPVHPIVLPDLTYHTAMHITPRHLPHLTTTPKSTLSTSLLYPTPPTTHDAHYPTPSTQPHHNPKIDPVHLTTLPYLICHTQSTSPHPIYPTPPQPQNLPCHFSISLFYPTPPPTHPPTTHDAHHPTSSTPPITTPKSTLSTSLLYPTPSTPPHHDPQNRPCPSTSEKGTSYCCFVVFFRKSETRMTAGVLNKIQ